MVFLGLMIGLVYATPPHPYYLSICQIYHNSESQSLEISLKIFSDDLERALEEQGTGRLYLSTDKEVEAADGYIGKYLNQHFKLAVGDQVLKQNYLGKEYEEDAVWCYIEVKDVPRLPQLRVTNNLLMEVYDSQTNIVHIKAGKQEKSILLTKAKQNDRVEFD